MTPPTIDKLAAASGQLDMAPEAALELLVALTEEEDSEIRLRANGTIASWNDDKLRPVLRRLGTSPEVLKYFLNQDTMRLEILPVVLCNRSTPQDAIADLAALANMETVKILLDNIDRLRTNALIALRNNVSYTNLYENRFTEVEDGFVFEPNLLEMLIIEARLEDERTGNVGLTDEEIEEHDKAIAAATGDEDKKHESIYAKILKMSVSQKVQMALKGGKEERSLLIRDTSKVIVRAVLGSPRLTDTEIEAYSKQTSVSDEVLRLISGSRKFMKSYTVLKNLVNNPRTPVDVSLPLLSRMIITDVKQVGMNKNVSEMLRKMAIKHYK